MKKTILSLLIILVIGLLAACNQDDETNEKEDLVVPVETVQATVGDLVIEKSVYGRAEPGSTTPIMLENPGELDERNVENGDMVEEDDLIAKVNTPAGKQNIYAPKDGEIANLEAVEGARLSNTEPFAVVIDTDEMQLSFTVTSDVRSLLKKDDKLKTTINNKEYDAEITLVDTMPDETGLYPLKASVKNKDAEIVPGMIARLYVPEKQVKETILLPTAAMMEDSDGNFVYVIKDNQAIKTAVTVKETQSDQTAVEGDVKEGDQVVVNGQLTLSDESKVDVVEEGNPS